MKSLWTWSTLSPMNDEIRESAMEGAIDYARDAGREVAVVRDGGRQTITIPRELELDVARAIIRRDGERLVIEPARENDLLSYLRSLDPAECDFPDVGDDALPPLDAPDL